MKAIILAAGKGNRLLPYTENIPKPLLPISPHRQTTILDYIINNLPIYIDEIIIVVKHHKDKIIDDIKFKKDIFLKQNPNLKSITHSEQSGAKGTMGALLSIAHFFDLENKDSPEKFLVINGDDIHSREELDKFKYNSRSFGIQQKIMPGYKSVILSPTNQILRLDTQNEYENRKGCLIATGAYILDTVIFSFEPIVLNDGEIGLPQTLLAYANEYPIYGVEETQWIPINTVSDLHNLWHKDKK